MDANEVDTVARLKNWSMKMDELGMTSLAMELEEFSHRFDDQQHLLNLYWRGLGVKVHGETDDGIDVEFTRPDAILEAIGREAVAKWLTGAK